MSFNFYDGTLIITVSMLGTLALALFSYFLGVAVKRCFPILVRLSMPAPVIGGLIFCVTNSILSSYGIVTIELSRTVQTLAMIAFMCSIGLMGSFTLIRKGGLVLLAFWLAGCQCIGCTAKSVGRCRCFLFRTSRTHRNARGRRLLNGRNRRWRRIRPLL